VKLLCRLAWSAARIYLLLVVLIGLLQRKLLYHPAHASEAELVAEAGEAGLEPWRDSSGQLLGWQRSRGGTQKLLVFQGNAGSAVNRAGYAAGFGSLDLGKTWDVWLFEYPGYGARPGSPSRAAFAEAAHAAAELLLAQDARPLYLLGESIGSGVACDLAAQEPERVRGLVLVTPFARLADVASTHFPFLPVRLLLRDRWDNLAALAGNRARTAVLIAGQDEVIGTAQSEILFAGVGAAKRRWVFPDATHNDPEIQAVTPWVREVSDFMLDRGPTNP
jgi:uncharacterized protein